MAINDNFFSGTYGSTLNQIAPNSGSFLSLPNTDYLSSLQQSIGNTGSFVDNSIGIDPTNNLATQDQGGFFSNGKGGAGWGTQAIGAGLGLAQTFLGFSQLSEGKKQNRIAQQQWQAQFDIQKEEYDRRTAERAQRVADNQAAKSRAGG